MKISAVSSYSSSVASKNAIRFSRRHKNAPSTDDVARFTVHCRRSCSVAAAAAVPVAR